MDEWDFSKHPVDTGEDSIRENVPLEKGTRNMCLAGLSLALLCSVVCIVMSAMVLSVSTQKEQAFYRINFGSPIFQEFVPLLINVVISAVTECMGFIHATALRWALGDQLTFNSNLRLFSTVKGGHFSLGRIANFFQALALIMSYCATSLLFISYLPPEACDNGFGAQCEVRGIGALNPAALLALGVGLLTQAVVAFLQFRSVKISTWASTPLETAWASLASGRRKKEEGRCMMGVHDRDEPSAPRPPMARQRPAWSAHPEVRRVVVFQWVVVVLGFLWFVIVIGVLKRIEGKCVKGCDFNLSGNWALVPDSADLKNAAIIGTHTFERLASSANQDSASLLAGTFFFIMAFQSFLTMGLHCAELLVNMSRDEDNWRSAGSSKGYKPANAFNTAVRSWKTALLILAKPIIHWLFGLAITLYAGLGVAMRPPQILYMSLCLVLIAGFGTWLCFAKPSGPQPAAYGHIQTLVDLVDQWSPDLFWGDKAKASSADGVRHAGTASEGSLVGEIDMDAWYAGAARDNKKNV